MGAFSTPGIAKFNKPIAYAVKHKNDIVRENSRSGGIFTALSDEVLEENGVVYGCVLDDSFRAVHVRSEDVESRNSMRGSKYIQSEMKETFSCVRRDLEDGRRVLFSGTPCQISGLESFIGKEYENLLCVDIVCYGVPSPLLWISYIKWLESIHNSDVIKTEFRNKKDYGWRDHVETVYMSNGKKVNSTIFKSIFSNPSFLRPCCYRCPYKDIVRPGDITIGDCWGIERIAPEFDDNKGVSLVLINNEKGIKAFRTIENDIHYVKTDVDKCLQFALKESHKRPKEREKLWNMFYNMSYEDFLKKMGYIGIKSTIKRHCYLVRQKYMKL